MTCFRQSLGLARTCCRVVVFLVVLAVSLVWVASSPGYQILHSFSGSDGRTPVGDLAVVDSTLYGSTYMGGSAGGGSVYRIGTDGSDFTVLQHLPSAVPASHPGAGVTLAGTSLYGTCASSSTSWSGAIFKVNLDGTGYDNIHTFHNGDDGGYQTSQGLAYDGSKLFGATVQGGGNGDGALFSMNTDGTGFSVLHSFAESTDGSSLSAPMIASGTTLYSVNWSGGQGGAGTLFKMDTDGENFTLLHDFVSGSSEGAYPCALMLDGSTLYGATYSGGQDNHGTIFKVNIDGSDFTTLHTFLGGVEGARPHSGLTVIGSTLYGVAYEGAFDDGILFQVGTDGNNFDILHAFEGGPGDGANPNGELIAVGSILYGCTGSGGATGNGTLYSFAVVPEPSSLLLLGIGAIMVAASGLWRKKCVCP